MHQLGFEDSHPKYDSRICGWRNLVVSLRPWNVHVCHLEYYHTWRLKLAKNLKNVRLPPHGLLWKAALYSYKVWLNNLDHIWSLHFFAERAIQNPLFLRAIRLIWKVNHVPRSADWWKIAVWKNFQCSRYCRKNTVTNSEVHYSRFEFVNRLCLIPNIRKAFHSCQGHQCQCAEYLSFWRDATH